MRYKPATEIDSVKFQEYLNSTGWVNQFTTNNQIFHGITDQDTAFWVLNFKTKTYDWITDNNPPPCQDLATILKNLA